MSELSDISSDIEVAVTVPVNVAIEAEHRVLDLSETRRILGKAQRIILQNCGCKTERGNCDSPRDVCISLDEAADYALENRKYSPREVGIGEALDALERSHEAGLVHMAYTMKGDDYPTLICSCCPCCCHTLGGLLRRGIAAKVLTSRYIAEDDPAKCIGCSRCVERCVFNARTVTGGELCYDPTRCAGCGLCVSTCPEGAIKMKPRKGEGREYPRVDVG